MDVDRRLELVMLIDSCCRIKRRRLKTPQLDVTLAVVQQRETAAAKRLARCHGWRFQCTYLYLYDDGLLKQCSL